jgi:putative nucleotidyltransferase with HDIG domain
VGKPLATPTFALDEELWFGEGTDVEAESRAAASLAAVGARIVGAKPFPIAARRLDELTRSTNTRIEQVVSVLESDPALSARLLRLVNSAGYGLKIRCTSVRHAAVLVGSRRLNQVATTAAILDLFDANNQRAVELLEHAAVVGSLCRYLAVHVGLPHDELFTCGFLHDIGKLMLLDAERERYADVLADHGGAPDQIHIEERRVFGFDHAVLGAHVLAAWNIPDPVPKVIAWHHAPARAMQDTVLSSMVQTLRLADLLAYVLALHDEKVGIEIVAASDSARYLDISDAQLAAMWQDLAALRDRSRARSHGEPELDAIVPKSELPGSAVPSQRVSRMSQTPNSTYRASRPLQEVPAHFPCNVCGKPSYGNVCPACGGHVCPDHQGASDEWCTTCRREFGHFRKRAELPLAIKIGVGALVGGTLAVGVVRAARSPGDGWIVMLVAPLVVVALWAVVLPVAYKLWQKLAFLQTRRHATPGIRLPVSRPQTVAIVSAPPAQLADDALGELDAPIPWDAPAVSIGPISTASLSLSVAPGSSPPLSVMPPAHEPSSSGRFPSGSHAPTQRSIESHPPVAPEFSAESVLPQSLLPYQSATAQPSVMLVTSDALLSVAPLYTGPLVSQPPSVAPAAAGTLGGPEVPAACPAVSRAPEASSGPEAAPVAPAPSLAPAISVSAAPSQSTSSVAAPSLGPAPTVPPARASAAVSMSEAVSISPVESSASASISPRISGSPAQARSPSIAAVASTAPVASVSPNGPAEPAPVASITPAPVASITPAPVASITPAPVASITPAPVASITPAPVASIPPMGEGPTHTFTTPFVEAGAGGGGASGADIGTAQDSSSSHRISDVPESAVIATSEGNARASLSPGVPRVSASPPSAAVESNGTPKDTAASNGSNDALASDSTEQPPESTSQANARVLFSRRPAAVQTNTAVAPERTIRCSTVALNACVPTSVSTVDPMNPEVQRTAFGS